MDSKSPRANTSTRTPRPTQLLRPHDHRHAPSAAGRNARLRGRHPCLHPSNVSRRVQLHLFHAETVGLEKKRQEGASDHGLLGHHDAAANQLPQDGRLLQESALHKDRDLRGSGCSGLQALENRHEVHQDPSLPRKLLDVIANHLKNTSGTSSNSHAINPN